MRLIFDSLDELLLFVETIQHPEFKGDPPRAKEIKNENGSSEGWSQIPYKEALGQPLSNYVLSKKREGKDDEFIVSAVMLSLSEKYPFLDKQQIRKRVAHMVSQITWRVSTGRLRQPSELEAGKAPLSEVAEDG